MNKPMSPERLVEILVDEFDKGDLPPSTRPHVDALRNGKPITPGLQCALNAMSRAVREATGAE